MPYPCHLLSRLAQINLVSVAGVDRARQLIEVVSDFSQLSRELVDTVYDNLASGPITLLQIDGEIVETVADFILEGSKIIADGDCSHEIERCLLLGF